MNLLSGVVLERGDICLTHFTGREKLNRVERDSVYRILDASANRCREGLRVVEEYVRFHCNDSELTEQLKSLRHELQNVLAGLQLEQHLHSRDTAGDVGTKITLPSEQSRTSLLDLVAANSKRIQESLRVLEEYSKLLQPETAARFEKIRYCYYDREKRIFQTTRTERWQKLEKTSVYLLINERECRVSLEQTVREAAQGGVGVFQLRDKTLDDRQLLEQARRLRRLTRETDTLLIINDRPDLALLAEADGVHVGQEELTVADVRQVVGTELLIGVSTHSLAQARQARDDGADYLGVGPVFASGTKHFQELAGLELPREVAGAEQQGEISLPWFAIGGITTGNIVMVQKNGARRVAVSQVVLKAESPEQVVRNLRKNLEIPGTEFTNTSS